MLAPVRGAQRPIHRPFSVGRLVIAPARRAIGSAERVLGAWFALRLRFRLRSGAGPAGRAGRTAGAAVRTADRGGGGRPPDRGPGGRSGRGGVRRHGVGGVGRARVHRAMPSGGHAKYLLCTRGLRTPPTMLKAELEHSWRWRESNPRPSVHHQGFSGRSLLRFSQPRRSRKRDADRLSHCSMSRLIPRPGQAVILLADARHRVEGTPGLTDF
jgi:hypothetical protein